MRKELLEIIESELEETNFKVSLINYCGELIDSYKKEEVIP